MMNSLIDSMAQPTSHQGLLPQLTPTTATLLQWWFGRSGAAASGHRGFSAAQQEVLLRTIVAHELPPENSNGRWQHEVALGGASERLLVLLALLIWQLLNRHDALAANHADTRFTRYFLLVAPCVAARARLYSGLCGTRGPAGARDFVNSELVRHAELLVPDARRDEVLRFAYCCVYGGAQRLDTSRPGGVIAITGDRIEALEYLARLPHTMLLDDQSGPSGVRGGQDNAIWSRHLGRVAAARGLHPMQVVFSDPLGGWG